MDLLGHVTGGTASQKLCALAQETADWTSTEDIEICFLRL